MTPRIRLKGRRRTSLRAQLRSKVLSFVNKIFDNPVGRPAKKILITLAGIFVTLIGFALIILPGPAFLLIPVGLAILALEYPVARKLLRKFQGWMTRAARKADDFFARRNAQS